MLALFRYLLLAIFLTIISAICLVLCPIILLVYRYNATYILGHIVAIPTCKILGIKLNVTGSEHIYKKTPAIYISNHQSNLDLFIVAAIMPRKTISIGKRSIAFIPIFGQVYWLSGNILIDRTRRQKAIKTLSLAMQKTKQNGINIWLFPEGTRSQDLGILPFKKGPFHMAIKAQVPLRPIVLSSYVGKLNFNARTSGVVHIKGLAEISTKGMQQQDVPKLMDTCRKLFIEQNAALDKV